MQFQYQKKLKGLHSKYWICNEKNVSTSKNPMAMAAASIHLAAVTNKEKVSQLKISEASGISAVTIRDRAKEIKEKIGGEING